MGETNSLGERLRRRRSELNLSRREIVRRTANSISNSYVALIEDGAVKSVSNEKLSILAKAYDLTFAELLALSMGKKPDEKDIRSERIARINFGYDGLPPAKQKQLDPLIDLLEREYQRLMAEEGKKK